MRKLKTREKNDLTNLYYFVCRSSHETKDPNSYKNAIYEKGNKQATETPEQTFADRVLSSLAINYHEKLCFGAIFVRIKLLTDSFIEFGIYLLTEDTFVFNSVSSVFTSETGSHTLL